MSDIYRTPVPIGSRIYEYMWNVQVGWAMHNIALYGTGIVRFEGLEPVIPDIQMFNSWQTDTNIGIPVKGVFESAVHNINPPVIWYQTQSRNGRPYPLENSPDATTIGTGGPMASIMDATFCLFVEKCNDWLRVNQSNSSYHSWPPVSNFCRVVRNAVVHGGKINISSANAPQVSWNKLSYDHTSKGRDIFKDLSNGDFILLALDLDQEMDCLGAPALL